MQLSYDGIVFDNVLLNGWQTEAILSEDGCDFLYWHHVIDVVVILNPAKVNAASFPADNSSFLKTKNQRTTQLIAKRINDRVKLKSKLSQDFRSSTTSTLRGTNAGLISPGAVIQSAVGRAASIVIDLLGSAAAEEVTRTAVVQIALKTLKTTFPPQSVSTIVAPVGDPRQEPLFSGNNDVKNQPTYPLITTSWAFPGIPYSEWFNFITRPGASSSGRSFNNKLTATIAPAEDTGSAILKSARDPAARNTVLPFPEDATVESVLKPTFIPGEVPSLFQTALERVIKRFSKIPANPPKIFEQLFPLMGGSGTPLPNPLAEFPLQTLPKTLPQLFTKLSDKSVSGAKSLLSGSGAKFGLESAFNLGVATLPPRALWPAFVPPIPAWIINSATEAGTKAIQEEITRQIQKKIDDIAKQANDAAKALADVLGIDLGRLWNTIPPERAKFVVPPVKRKLNDPPPRDPRGSGTTKFTFPATDTELRTRLRRPRRTLAVWINSGPNGDPEYVLYQPFDGMNMDAFKGPMCREMPTKMVVGNVTGIKHLVFETWESPLNEYGTDDQINKSKGGGIVALINSLTGLSGKLQNAVKATPALISNRWSMKQLPQGETGLSSTIIEGTAIFRMDILNAKGISADQLRPLFMHPIPFGYVRMPPEVSQSSDGSRVDYRVVDVQQMINNPAGAVHGVKVLNATQSMEYSSPIDFVRPPYNPGGGLSAVTNEIKGFVGGLSGKKQ